MKQKESCSYSVSLIISEKNTSRVSAGNTKTDCIFCDKPIDKNSEGEAYSGDGQRVKWHIRCSLEQGAKEADNQIVCSLCDKLLGYTDYSPPDECFCFECRERYKQ